MKKFLVAAVLLCLSGCAMGATVQDDMEEGEVQVSLNQEWEEEQKKKEVEYRSALNNGDYTLENFFVKVNPYGTSPLTALVQFQTDIPMRTRVTVSGKDAETEISYAFDEYVTKHSLPITGLYAGQTNSVQLTLTDEHGNEQVKIVPIDTEPLPDSFSTIDVEKTEGEPIDFGENQLTFIIPSTKQPYAFDENGDVRWYSTKYNSHVFEALENGNLLYLTKQSNDGDTYNVLLETDYLGKIYHRYDFSASTAANESGKSEQGETTVVHHDGIELPNGNLLLTVNDGSKYIEDTMVEVDRETGEIVKTIDLKDVFPKEMYEEYESTKREDGKVDWFHQNSVVYDTSDDSIILSGRHQDAIVKIDYQTSQIKWIISEGSDWPKSMQKYLLSGKIKAPGGQHAAVIMPDQDGNSDTLDLMFYDNNIAVTHGDKEASEKYSEAQQIRINEKTGTVEEIWTFGEELGESYHTRIIGSAYYLPETANCLINFGYRKEGKVSSILEVDRNGQKIFQADISGFPTGAWVYRAKRQSIRPEAWTY
ncbi:aryl-sulfate sulfotransferase [Enterococcus florum]|uniref:Aryl-sulfate sulfotransferase n=1 Tax=Enterococcus florum TaxID=2480627 RepID=A0A4P5PLK6_9ENTE|nr:aryl-sulfate sulfotransferase [Enterococcus florum]GCF94153.1 aryl-sulfate sulfotransferase [Enterococcus florum]